MLDKIAIKFQKFAPLFLRLGLAAVFFIFALKKLANPSQSTAEVQLLSGFELADAAALSYYLGLIEMAVAVALFLGFKVRVFAIIASLLVSFFFISFLSKYGLSINPDIYRDIGLLGAAIALFLLGEGPWSLDAKLSKKAGSSNQ